MIEKWTLVLLLLISSWRIPLKPLLPLRTARASYRQVSPRMTDAKDDSAWMPAQELSGMIERGEGDAVEARKLCLIHKVDRNL
jgi:hypothetical protein